MDFIQSSEAIKWWGPGHRHLAPGVEEELRSDLKTLAHFVSVYCKYKHPRESKALFSLKGVDAEAVTGRPTALCASCTKLLSHAFVKRMNCPQDPKPACNRCSEHCYHPKYRRDIREVMKYSGRKLILSGRLDYLYHLLFG